MTYLLSDILLLNIISFCSSFCYLSDFITFEGDIIAYDKEELEDYDYFDDAISSIDALWALDPETGTVPIPFMVDDYIDFQTKENIERAVKEYNEKTCIR